MTDNISSAASHKRLPLGRLHEVKSLNNRLLRALRCNFCASVKHALRDCPQLADLKQAG
jgi:hypothetical protein